MCKSSPSLLEERVLVLTPTGKDAALAVSLLAAAGMAAEACADVAALCDGIKEGAGALLVAQEALSATAAPELVDCLAAQPAWSDLPIIVLTSGGEHADRSRRAIDAFGPSGNVTLLERPFRALTLGSVVLVALRSRRRQYQVRGLFHERDQLLERERLARADAEAANRMKDEFLASLSHELRTPLNAILGWTQLLRMGTVKAGELEHGLEVIERNANIQTQLIDELLDVSRIISGKMRLEMQPVRLPEIIEAALAVVAPMAKSKEIRVEQALDTSAGPVTGDPGRLQQVVWNLLTNAIKFTPPGGRIQIGLDRSRYEAEITIADNGAGIKPDFLPYVFDRFRQGDATTTRRHGGLGLGLSIVRQLVELHGGTVHVDSPGERQGSTFHVSLPLSTAHEGAKNLHHDPRPAAARESPDLLEGVRVLVVDDEPDARDLVARLLVERGAVVRSAGSAAEALERLAEFRPQIFIGDIGMPEQDGYDLMRRIRGQGLTAKQMPAVALTAFARADDRQRALSAGYQVHVAKPVNASELTSLVASLADRQ